MGLVVLIPAGDKTMKGMERERSRWVPDVVGVSSPGSHTHTVVTLHTACKIFTNVNETKEIVCISVKYRSMGVVQKKRDTCICSTFTYVCTCEMFMLQ